MSGNIAIGTDTTENINAAIALPKRLFADDGREFFIKTWDTQSSVDDVTTVTITAIVCLPEVEE